MNAPKTIYVPDRQCTLVWSPSTNEVTHKKHEYISVEQLKAFIGTAITTANSDEVEAFKIVLTFLNETK